MDRGVDGRRRREEDAVVAVVVDAAVVDAFAVVVDAEVDAAVHVPLLEATCY